jgi:hypothetical protein
MLSLTVLSGMTGLLIAVNYPRQALSTPAAHSWDHPPPLRRLRNRFCPRARHYSPGGVADYAEIEDQTRRELLAVVLKAERVDDVDIRVGLERCGGLAAVNRRRRRRRASNRRCEQRRSARHSGDGHWAAGDRWG